MSLYLVLAILYEDFYFAANCNIALSFSEIDSLRNDIKELYLTSDNVYDDASKFETVMAMHGIQFPR